MTILNKKVYKILKELTMMEANILVVNTIKDLLNLSQNEINKYGRFSLRGYHKIDDAVYFYGYWNVVYYIWNPESTKEHNGGSIIDPNAPFPKDWNNEQQLEKWFNYSGNDSKAGRFELIVGDNTVNVKWFGAKGDGKTNDSIAIQKAIDTKMRVFSPDGHYALKDPLIFHEEQESMLFGCFSNMKTSSPNR